MLLLLYFKSKKNKKIIKLQREINTLESTLILSMPEKLVMCFHKIKKNTHTQESNKTQGSNQQNVCLQASLNA